MSCYILGFRNHSEITPIPCGTVMEALRRINALEDDGMIFATGIVDPKGEVIYEDETLRRALGEYR